MSRDDYGRGRGFGRSWDDDRDDRYARRGPRSSEQYDARRLEPGGTGDYGRRRAREDEYDRTDEPGFFERAADTVISWFGGDDDDREYGEGRRRQMDESRRHEMRERARRDIDQGRLSDRDAESRSYTAADYRGGEESQRRSERDRDRGTSRLRSEAQPSRIPSGSRTSGYGPYGRTGVEFGPTGTSKQSDASGFGDRESRELDLYRSEYRGGARPSAYQRGGERRDRDIAPIGVSNRSYDASTDRFSNADDAGSYGAGRQTTDVHYDTHTIGTGAQTHGTLYGQSTGHGIPVDRYSGNVIESPIDTGAARGAAGYEAGEPGRSRDYVSGTDSRSGSGRSSRSGGGTLGSTYGSVLGRGGDIERAQRGPFTGKGPKGYQRSDERIREEINERLMEDDRIDASEIDIEVKSGVVTLSGKVDDRRVKWMTEDLVEEISGVKDVQNNLRVDRTYRSDTMF